VRGSLRKGRVTYMSATGPTSVKAKRVGKRLVARVDLRGLTPAGGQWAVLCTGKDRRGRSVERTVIVRL
jgi:hypothetical protein